VLDILLGEGISDHVPNMIESLGCPFYLPPLRSCILQAECQGVDGKLTWKTLRGV
jgi:hypothetical protein